MRKLNFSCIVGTDAGYLEIINGFDWEVQNKINLRIPHISFIKKHEDEYFLSSLNKLFNLKQLSEESKSLIYSPIGNCGDIIGFDFFEKSTVIGYENQVQIIKDRELVQSFGSGKFEAFRLLKNGDIAVAGKKTELHVYHPEGEGSLLFKSRGEPNKRLSLPAKVHLCSIEQDVESDSVIYCGTRFGTVQLYDIRTNQRTAQLTANFEQNQSVRSLVALGPQKVIGGSSNGQLGIIDFRLVHRSRSKVSKASVVNYVANYAKFKGFVGNEVSDIAVAKAVNCSGSRFEDLLLSTSLDGHFSVYRIESRELDKKIYLGKAPSCILIDSVNQYGRDDVWNELENIEQSMTTNRKRLRDGTVANRNKSQ